MKIMVTGALGQLGTEIKRLAENSQHHFVFTDRDDLDITSYQAVEEGLRQGFDGIINCAAYTAVDKAETDKEKCYALNSQAVENLAKACHKHHLFLVHISTDYVFDGRQFLPYQESDDPNPLSVYGTSKLEGEERAFGAHDHVTIIRTSWLYSPYGSNFVKTIRRLLGEKPEIRVVFDQVGTPTAARTLANVIVNFLDVWKESKNTIYHYSNEGIASWYDFAVAIARFSGYSVPILPISTEEYPTPAKRPHYSVLDKRKIKASLGITIPHWQEALEETIREITQGV
ncbi:dTDP-4-dehydrorhamnose reductase [Thermospira aquatica]|uniref:dTDP-4-dehydrorhamnose reductase n=1 Tax=Thermospira aquatica TaxID=2828656 RepID=A0AAX3BHX2_9SPIR|nr:dTDP-4-dehydrorhamnose reductase [Thermospira aquatica]URA10981.1 dTDP-4-dehydrorhamnose reductase [Thermospira aquatica]